MPRTSRNPVLAPTAEAGMEILDDTAKTLLIMPQAQAIRQKLLHRVVLVCPRNAEGHVFLYKKAAASVRETHEKAWLPAASCRPIAGESRYEAGTRLLNHIYGISGVELLEAATFRQPVEYPAGNAVTTLFLTAKTSIIPRLREEEASDGIFVDKEEFRAVMRDYPHMVTPLWNLVLPYF